MRFQEKCGSIAANAEESDSEMERLEILTCKGTKTLVAVQLRRQQREVWEMFSAIPQLLWGRMELPAPHFHCRWDTELCCQWQEKVISSSFRKQNMQAAGTPEPQGITITPPPLERLEKRLDKHPSWTTRTSLGAWPWRKYLFQACSIVSCLPIDFLNKARPSEDFFFSSVVWMGCWWSDWLPSFSSGSFVDLTLQRAPEQGFLAVWSLWPRPLFVPELSQLRWCQVSPPAMAGRVLEPQQSSLTLITHKEPENHGEITRLERSYSSQPFGVEGLHRSRTLNSTYFNF